MPDNLYWLLGIPTKDEEVLAAREEERKRRNEEYGRVSAGGVGEEEVHAYYDYRMRLSADYFEFAEFMQRRHQDNPSDCPTVGIVLNQAALSLSAEFSRTTTAITLLPPRRPTPVPRQKFVRCQTLDLPRD